VSLGAGLVLPSFPGSGPPDWIRRFLADGGRGIVLFAYNVDDLPALAASLRAEREDVLLALDEEGGDVTRLEWREGSSYPSAAALGALDEPALTEEVAAAIAADLAAAGVNWNFAPVADVNVPANPVIGVRSFGSDASLVARHVAAAVRGFQRVGVAACAKHFPGLGTAGDSTDNRPHVDARTRPAEVAAFRTLIRAGVPCVMTSNAFYDGAPYRASISPDTYQRLRALGFDGVAITDSLSIVKAAPVERWARQAVLAGADLLLFTSAAHARRAIAALVPLAQEGKLDASVERVLRFQSRLLRTRRP
jgi:beta-N-acetylhexosaminidase